MIGRFNFKVCGITSVEGADAASACGADFLGFIFHDASPRRMDVSQYARLADRLPSPRRVAVSVEPSDEALRGQLEAGFTLFQVHFRPELGRDRLGTWSRAVGPERLWLAPKLPPGASFDPAWLPFAETFLMDGFAPDKFGGTGRTTDWEAFARLQARYPERRWILSGGLRPDNIQDAIRSTGATWVDVNSGVESAPGVKDVAKLQAFAAALGAAV